MPPDADLDESTLPERDRAALAFVRSYSAEHKRPPSIREVGEHLALPHPNNAKRILDKLEGDGWLVRGMPPVGRPRVMRIAFSPHHSFSLPILGLVGCGTPLAVGDPTNDRFDFEKAFGGGDTFMVEARGDSMIDDQISPGDLIVIRRQPEAEFGDKVVCMIDGEMTLKIYRENRGAKWLFPCNPNHEPIRLEASKDNVIVGVATGVVRQFKPPKARNRKR